MKIKYTGILATPMPYSRPPGPLATEQDREAWVEGRVRAWRERMDALFDFHEIKRDNWNMLAGALAEAHVPGLAREKAPRGPKRKWDEVKRAELKIEIEDCIRAASPRRMSISAAIRAAARREPWKSALTRSRDCQAALRKQYDLADARWVRILRMARAWEIHKKNPNMPLNELNALGLGN